MIDKKDIKGICNSLEDMISVFSEYVLNEREEVLKELLNLVLSNLDKERK